MKSEQGTQSCFSGTGELTCHQFIRSIREEAIEAGKQRDDEWMADQASIRLDGEALKWFESLDDEVQTDWKRLKRAILTRYGEPLYEEVAPDRSVPAYEAPRPPQLQFKGESEAECKEFVHQIRQRGFVEGKEHDSGWMVRQAFPCFVGKALKWHASLPSDVQNSWKALERAILLDFPNRPTSPISPASIRVNDWYSFVPPSSAVQSIRSHTDWINQAKARRKQWEASQNKSTPCWLLIENEKQVPDNAIRTGSDVGNNPLYSVRSWYQNAGLLVGKWGPHLSGAHLALNLIEIPGVTPFEILVGDPSHFKWIAVPERPTDHRAVAPSPFNGVEAGFENCHRHRATFISQIWHEGSWQPGKAHSGDLFAFTGFCQKEVLRHTIRVLAWAE